MAFIKGEIRMLTLQNGSTKVTFQWLASKQSADIIVKMEQTREHHVLNAAITRLKNKCKLFALKMFSHFYKTG